MRYCVNLYLNWYRKYERSKLKRLNLLNTNGTFNFDLLYFRSQLRYKFTQYIPHFKGIISGIKDGPFKDKGMPLVWQYCYLTVSAQIERHSWLERQETHFGRTMVNFGEKAAKNTVIFEDFSPK